MKRIVVLETLNANAVQLAELEALGKVDWYKTSSHQECQQRIEGADVVVVNWVDPSPFILQMKPNSLLALMSTGYEWVQHREEARKKNILISNIPGYSTEAVAEHLLGLTLCVIRQTVVADQSVRNKQPSVTPFQGIELFGKTLGVLGVGRIGGRLAQLGAAIGMKVLGYSRHLIASTDLVRHVSLDQLLQQSDVLAICCPSNSDSKGLLNAARISQMKKGAVLVGATWGVVELEALADALDSGHLRGAGLDAAVEGGAIELPDRLLKCPNFVVTPHIAFNTVEAVHRQISIGFSNIAQFLSGTPTNIVN